MSRSLRTLRTSLPLALFLSGAPIVAGAATRVLESDARHVRIEIVPAEPRVTTVSAAGRQYVRIRLPRLGATEETGRPEVPVGGARVALPPRATPRLRVVEQRWSSSRPGAVVPVPERVAIREAFRPNQVVEREPVEGPEYHRSPTYPERVFELSEVRDVRGVRVASVIYHPVVADVGARSYKVLERAVLEVTFEEASERSAPRPTARPAPLGELWDRTLRSNVLNAEQARPWVRGGPGDGPTVGNAPWGGGDQWKVLVDRTGIVEIAYSALAAAGFPAGVPVGEVSVYQRTFDLDRVDDSGVAASDLFVPLPVPVLVRDRDSNGLFGGQDGILLYTRSFRDQWVTSGLEHEDKHDPRNYVWVRREAGGARMAVSRPGGSLSGAPFDSLDSTPAKAFRENDLRYYDHPPDHNLGSEDFETEIYYWNDARAPTLQLGWGVDDSFTAVDPVLGRPATVLVRVAPGGKVHRAFSNRMEYHLNGTMIGTDSWYNQSQYIGSNFVPPSNCLFTHTAADGVLDGANSFRFWGWTFRGISSTNYNNVARFFMDWYEITYDRHLRASGDRLALSTENGPPSNVLARVQGFAGSDILLFDVTDPAAPTAVDVDAATQIVGSGPYDLRFDHDNALGPATFEAVREASVPAISSGAITLVPPATVLAQGVGAQYLIVSHDDFITEAQTLASYRSAEYSTHTVATSHVYDVFNNGARHPRAIKSLAAYAYHRATEPLVFLTLIGDASEDHQGLLPNSNPDLVPSHSLYAEYEGAPEDTDQYYAELTRPAPGDPFDDLADIYVGRLAVNTPEELAWNVVRIIAYENEDLDEPWRRRVLLTADDQFSGSLGGGLGTPYGWQPFEAGFETVSNEICDLLDAHPTDTIHCEKILLSDWSHPCSDDCYRFHSADCENELGIECGFWYDCRNASDWQAEYVCMRENMWQTILPIVRDRLNRGVLLWNFQGHANRFFMTHEEIFKDFSDRHDVETSLLNQGKPFIFLGYACHLAEFDKFDEGSSSIVDCLSEKMMNLRPFVDEEPGGAIAVFASSGFEFLDPNLVFNTFQTEAFFYPEIAIDPANLAPGASVPSVGPSGAYKWTLGESTTRARLMFQAIPYPPRTRQAAQRFVLLGDPALSPRLGNAEFEVTVDDVPVADPASLFYIDSTAGARTLQVEVVASNSRGVTAMRVVDSERGILDPSEYAVVDSDVSNQGVVIGKTLSHELSVRANRDYDVLYEASGPDGKMTEFTARITSRFEFASGAPVVFPNPFQDEVQVVYDFTAFAHRVRVGVYTLNGRKIWEKTEEDGKQPNVQYRVEWPGRDSNDNPVANGTYFVRILASGSSGELETTVPAVKMR